ncbi:MAG: hypothetical protein GC202_11385 [Alphaproteobacteria bacterium]|nr:hypothetical protein [Alphaproteobacteria bacterium]
MLNYMPYRPAPFDYVRPHRQSKSPDPDLASELARRGAAQAALVRSRETFAIAAEADRAELARRTADYEAAKRAFLGKYGADAPTVDDRLADLAALETMRVELERFGDLAHRSAAMNDRTLLLREATDALATAGWDMRFAATEQARADGRARFEAMCNRLAVFAAETALETGRANAHAASVKAGTAALIEGLEGPALFRVRSDGVIEFDANGLDTLSPDARATGQLKRLAEIMAARNGLSPVEGAHATALKLQAMYAAGHPVDAGTVMLPF